MVSIALNLAGLFVTAVMITAHIERLSLPCGVDGGCNSLVFERASYWWGIPISYFGFATYLLLLILNLFRIADISAHSRWPAIVNVLISGAGTFVSFALILYARFFIHQLCLWCFASAGIMTLSWPVAAALYIRPPRFTATQRRLFAPSVLLMVAITIISTGWVGRNLREDAGNAAVCDAHALAKLPVEQLDPTDAPSIGPRTATTTIVVFSDFMCPVCRQTYRKLRELAGNDSNIRLVYRHFPLNIHPGAYQSAVDSEVAAQTGRFWEFADAFMTSFDIRRTQRLTNASLKSAKPNPQSRVAIARVRRDVDLAQRLHIRAVPALIVIDRGVYARAAKLQDLDGFR